MEKGREGEGEGEGEKEGERACIVHCVRIIVKYSR